MTRDPQIWLEAAHRLPLPELMRRIGDGQYAEKGADCPFCGNTKKKWGVFRRSNGRWQFKCHRQECSANNPEFGHGEIGYLALRKGWGAKEAAREFLRLAVPDILEAQEEERRKHKENNDQNPGAKAKDGNATTGPEKIWQSLHSRLVLTTEDRALLKSKRGFSDEIIDFFGYRSNNHTNAFHIQNLAKDFGEEALIEEGILKPDRQSARACPQLVGYGITKKKDDRGEPVFEINNPILIPYLDEAGSAYFLRPHKGGVKRPKDDLWDDDIAESVGEEAPCAGHVYCPFAISAIEEFDGLAVLTEGEFKVAALHQCRIPALCVPGITFIRNPAFKRELVDLLKRLGVRELVVMFDNEVKDDPNYPDKYKADPIKRWETQKWAEYTAIVLREYFKAIGGSVKIGWLPNECRIEGKADFDGVLAKEVAEHGLKEGTTRARAIFRKAIADASERGDVLELFPSESRRIIEYGLTQLFTKPKLPIGGDHEEALARKYSALDPASAKRDRIDPELAERFRAVKGCYYERETVNKETRETLLAVRGEIQARLAKHNSGEAKLSQEMAVAERNRLSAVFERLKGLPNPISNFQLRCEFKRFTADGKMHRLVRIKNAAEKKWSKDLYKVEASNIARLAEFREWIYNTGKGVWLGGDKDLQCLVMDLDRHSFLREIFEIDQYGEHKESKLWFFADCAFATLGKDPEARAVRLEPDPNGIFWHEGSGYQIECGTDDRGASFAQGAPFLLNGDPALDLDEVRDLFLQMLQDMHDTIGGFEGWLCVAALLEYAIGPELLKRHGGHPGLWMYGKMSGGKTTVARWLMQLWGFFDLQGVSIAEGTTEVGCLRFLSQYSSLPVWFDEFRKDQVSPGKTSAIRYAFDRGGATKGTAEGGKKTRIASGNTTPIITGENASSDAATKSRYAQVQVSPHKRIGDGVARYRRVQEESRHWHKIGRFLMENRPRFAKESLAILAEWMSLPKVNHSISNARLRVLYGAAYAVIEAMDNLLQAKTQKLGEFFEFLLLHGEESLGDVMDETFLNTFWRDLATGVQTGRIRRDKYFAVAKVARELPSGVLRPVDDDAPGCWVLYIAPAVFNEYSQDKRSRNEPVPMDEKAIMRELSKEPYFMPLPKGAVRTHRKRIDGRAYASCWVVCLQAAGDRQRFPYVDDLIPHVADSADLAILSRQGIIDHDLVPDQLV
jgi:hypothetical protein